MSILLDFSIPFDEELLRRLDSEALWALWIVPEDQRFFADYTAEASLIQRNWFVIRLASQFSAISLQLSSGDIDFKMTFKLGPAVSDHDSTIEFSLINNDTVGQGMCLWMSVDRPIRFRQLPPPLANPPPPPVEHTPPPPLEHTPPPPLVIPPPSPSAHLLGELPHAQEQKTVFVALEVAILTGYTIWLAEILAIMLGPYCISSLTATDIMRTVALYTFLKLFFPPAELPHARQWTIVRMASVVAILTVFTLLLGVVTAVMLVPSHVTLSWPTAGVIAMTVDLYTIIMLLFPHWPAHYTCSVAIWN
ncbi:hypothetical protein BV25DRAFT_1921754 [Artomyces pyxidatus]|uniref:Uncharacterized protein n=1 Tax=Artomyces pyxidatus TaxID=48021 RepID=A0ACB8SHV1_9AGAM|nr:hypothetical protein BV25DRAFT_1921754 [Artomyces pyxidatus]